VDQVQFDEVFREHFPFVWRCLRALGASSGDADDLAQEVFMVVHRRLGEFEGDKEIRAWLYGILRRVVNNYRRATRRAKVKAAALAHESYLVEAPRTASTSTEEREAVELVSLHLSKLEPRRREVFVLVELEELPVTTVAETLGIPLNTAYSRLRLARAEFRASLARGGQS
jgi:RNA polymerase sigma-70 factor, ECF subfamily